jgi:hypothetical protein
MMDFSRVRLFIAQNSGGGYYYDMVEMDMQPTKRRALGLYAIHWAQALDWLRLRKRQAAIPISTVPGRVLPRSGEKARNSQESEKEIAEEKLNEAVRETHRILAHTKSVFPFMLFPDSLTVDRQKLTIVYKQFFNAHQTVSVPLESVKNIQADLGPFFGSLTITSDLFINNVQKITCLPRHDVLQIQKLVQGITTAISEKIDLGKIKDTEQLKDSLCKLGEGHAELAGD